MTVWKGYNLRLSISKRICDTVCNVTRRVTIMPARFSNSPRRIPAPGATPSTPRRELVCCGNPAPGTNYTFQLIPGYFADDRHTRNVSTFRPTCALVRARWRVCCMFELGRLAWSFSLVVDRVSKHSKTRQKPSKDLLFLT